MVEGRVRRKLVGTVVSDRMDKTVSVLVQRLTRHQAYKKIVRRRAKYMAHDPQKKCTIGDRVRIIESRPMSKRKRWQVVDIIEKANIEA
jgi:small subunit ribosomal protein S17